MQNIATLKFSEGKEETFVIIRADNKNVGLCLTNREQGDVEVFISRAECKRLIDALEKSISCQD